MHCLVVSTYNTADYDVISILALKIVLNAFHTPIFLGIIFMCM